MYDFGQFEPQLDDRLCFVLNPSAILDIFVRRLDGTFVKL